MCKNTQELVPNGAEELTGQNNLSLPAITSLVNQLTVKPEYINSFHTSPKSTEQVCNYQLDYTEYMIHYLARCNSVRISTSII